MRGALPTPAALLLPVLLLGAGCAGKTEEAAVCPDSAIIYGLDRFNGTDANGQEITATIENIDGLCQLQGETSPRHQLRHPGGRAGRHADRYFVVLADPTGNVIEGQFCTAVPVGTGDGTVRLRGAQAAVQDVAAGTRPLLDLIGSTCSRRPRWSSAGTSEGPPGAGRLTRRRPQPDGRVVDRRPAGGRCRVGAAVVDVIPPTQSAFGQMLDHDRAGVLAIPPHADGRCRAHCRLGGRPRRSEPGEDRKDHGTRPAPACGRIPSVKLVFRNCRAGRRRAERVLLGDLIGDRQMIRQGRHDRVVGAQKRPVGPEVEAAIRRREAVPVVRGIGVGPLQPPPVHGRRIGPAGAGARRSPHSVMWKPRCSAPRRRPALDDKWLVRTSA